MISKQILSLNFMLLYSLIEELCTKEENDKTGFNFNFGHQCSNDFKVSLKRVYFRRKLKVLNFFRCCDEKYFFTCISTFFFNAVSES